MEKQPKLQLHLCALRNNKNKNDLYINMKRVNELPFDSDRKMMTTVHKLVNGKYRVITKGAPDVLLKRCTKYYDNGNIVLLDSSRRLKIEQENNNMAEQALRVIAVAYSRIEFTSK